jgi:hypothetical protein
MHHPPDLNLASSYIPACLCTLKCALAFSFFVLSPVRGWIGLCCLVLVDRILWNHSHTAILDVNAVVVSLLGGLMVMHTRVDGVHTVMHLAVVGVWILSSALQIVGATRLNRAYEVVLGACCVTVLSCLHQQQERTEMLALRVFVYVVANITLPYLSVMMQQYDIDTYVNVCRTMLILLGEPEIASVWVITYVLCIGYQMRGVPAARKQQCDCDDDGETGPPSSSSGSVVVIQDEAALLREALASRRGFSRET